MNNFIYNFYKTHYNLERLNINISKSNIYFLIYDDNFNYYFCKNNNLYIEDNKLNIINYINKISNDYNINIKNFYPVCYCNETLIIALRVYPFKNNAIKKYDYLQSDDNYISLINYHRKNYNTNFVFNNLDKEISNSKKYIYRYKIHNNIIKKYFLTEEKRKKNQFYNLLNNLIPDKESILDISCGDSLDIFKIAKKKSFKCIVGNDICLNYLNLNSNENVIYTNDNAEFNNIKKSSYDVVICKNTLHHMNDLISINNLLKNLKYIAKTIIIIEIYNPEKDKFMPKVLNKYLYTKFLKDVGKCYLDNEQFNSIINNNYQDYKIEYDEFTNILGTYMIAKIECGD